MFMILHQKHVENKLNKNGTCMKHKICTIPKVFVNDFGQNLFSS